MTDPIKKKVFLIIEEEEKDEIETVDNLAENDPDVEFWRQGNTEELVQRLIKEKIALNKDKRKFEKYKRFMLEIAAPSDRPGLLKQFGMPPEAPPGRAIRWNCNMHNSSVNIKSFNRSLEKRLLELDVIIRIFTYFGSSKADN